MKIEYVRSDMVAIIAYSPFFSLSCIAEMEA